MLLSFVVVYVIIGFVVVFWGYTLKFGEVCSPYVIVPLIGIILGDWILEKVNRYFSERIREPLSKRMNFDLYMGILNACMYVSIYAAGTLWVYRLSGKFFVVPVLISFGLVSGIYTLRKTYK